MYDLNMYCTNTKRPKNIWVSKIEKSKCVADEDTNNFYLSEEKSVFYFSSPMRKEIHLPNDKIQNHRIFELRKIPNLTS